MRSLSTTIYLAVVTVSAACGLIVEIAAGRMLAPYIGMSLYTWTAIIAVVLAGFSIGHWIGGRIAEGEPEKVRRHVIVALLLAGLATASSLVLIRLLAGPLIGWGLEPVPTILVLTMVLFFLPSLFVGIPAPALTKLAIDENPARTGHTLGTYYAAGAAGSIIGTLAAGFVFISWLGTIGTFLMVAAAYVAMAIVLVFADGRVSLKRLAGIVGFAVAGTVLIAVAGSRPRAFTSPCNTESDYYCIRVVDAAREFGVPARALILDHLGHGINLRDRPGTLVTPYVELHDILARIHSGKRTPFRAFFIGGGAFTLPRAWLAARPDAEIVVAEIDPAVTRTARDQLWLPEGARLTVRHRDARLALSSSPERSYDVVVGDAFHDITMPQHLATREFFDLVASRLREGGIYVMNVVDDRRHPLLAASIRKTLASAFPVVELWRSNETGRRATFVVAGLTSPTPYSTIGSRVSPGVAFARVGAGELSAHTGGAPIMLTDNFAPVDRLIGVR